ncbi:LPS export ABC transporter periplasmic protein LptC [Pantanalinema sp. GBBB05]|uniref:LPS export ABC transporter periplasmic protein LptC n=1 Tax=Pantanalinema sp. GBBB05 TaxID=2604139 RepID=UPI001D7447FC|nr:LPS export ABC transporter periplasmic protein LptC [Pantanalinema sp. GBBB05]
MPKLLKLRTTYRIISTIALLLSVIAIPEVIAGCNSQNRVADRIAQDAQDTDNFETNFSFNDVTLEDFNPKGELWWRVKAIRANYNKDKKLARVQQPNGEFYQDGKLIIRATAENGEVQQNGKNIFLRGKIVATDVRDGMVLKGNELEWRPKEELLLIRDNVTGTRKEVDASANAGRYLTRKRELTLDGKVAANVKAPRLLINTEQLVWLVSQQKLISDRPLTMDRYKSKDDKTVTDQATANRGSMDLNTETVTIAQNARLVMTKPPLNVAGNEVSWNLKSQMITSSQPIEIINRDQQVTLNGNRGELDLKTQIFYLFGNVRGYGARNGARLQADRLKWNDPTQQFEAEGNVTYSQAKPPFSTAGPKAAGKMSDQVVVVSGGRVVSEFVP